MFKLPKQSKESTVLEIFIEDVFFNSHTTAANNMVHNKKTPPYHSKVAKLRRKKVKAARKQRLVNQRKGK